MKTALITLFLFLFTAQIKGQYIPTILDGNTWEVRRNEGQGSSSDWKYVLKCDTLIENKLYNKVELSTGKTIGFLREDTLGQKVYEWDTITQSERLILDYTIEAGDSIMINNRFVTCQSVSKKMLYNKVRKFIVFPGYVAFIEGVGNTLYGIVNYVGGYQVILNFEEQLDICGTNAINKIQQDLEIMVFPNPVIDGFTIVSNKKVSGDMLIINIRGQIVKAIDISNNKTIDMTNLPNGIYFIKVNGVELKKIIKQ